MESSSKGGQITPNGQKGGAETTRPIGCKMAETTPLHEMVMKVLIKLVFIHKSSIICNMN
jgi:hypothetical protein